MFSYHTKPLTKWSVNEKKTSRAGTKNAQNKFSVLCFFIVRTTDGAVCLAKLVGQQESACESKLNDCLPEQNAMQI
jgi:hypothetical protein